MSTTSSPSLHASPSTGHWRVAALYHFAPIADPAARVAELAALCQQQGIKGTLLLATEGINGTVAGTPEAIAVLLDAVRGMPGFAAAEAKFADAPSAPFGKLKVKHKPEIVTMGVPGVDPRHVVGSYVDAEAWNALIQDPEVLVIDTRNDYEVAIGTFANAISPNTKHFREFPDYVARELAPQKDRKIAMFCTGGIRCEKASSYLLEQGFSTVYHLQGGILKYLETVKPDENLWQGECFVFDERVTVDKDLNPGQRPLCRACRAPLLDGDTQSPHFEAGVSCPQCYPLRTDAQRAAYRERERQMALAAARGERHLGKLPDGLA